VAVVPKGLLVTTGASFLVPAVLLALLAVGAIYAIHFGIHAKRRTSNRNLRRDIARLRTVALRRHRGPVRPTLAGPPA
jgi:hypothetical protein